LDGSAFALAVCASIQFAGKPAPGFAAQASAIVNYFPAGYSRFVNNDANGCAPFPDGDFQFRVERGPWLSI
jgi:hypothetical protein